jgi:hypothetical protein
MKKLTLFIGVLLSLVIAGCGGDIDSNSDSNSNNLNVSAPATISGKSFKAVITSGSGGFASSGRSVFVVSNTDNKYKVLGDSINTINTRGTFSYSANNNKATIVFNDSVLGKGNYHFTFISETKGTYTAESEQSSLAKQSGSFEVL